MMMTTSSNDGEALTAIRMANAMLMAEGQNWDEILGVSRQVTITLQRQQPTTYQAEDSWAPPHLSDKNVIEQMFRFALAGEHTASQTAFIGSLNDWWKRHGRLTQRQYTALRRIYNEVRRG